MTCTLTSSCSPTSISRCISSHIWSSAFGTAKIWRIGMKGAIREGCVWMCLVTSLETLEAVKEGLREAEGTHERRSCWKISKRAWGRLCRTTGSEQNKLDKDMQSDIIRPPNLCFRCWFEINSHFNFTYVGMTFCVCTKKTMFSPSQKSIPNVLKLKKQKEGNLNLLAYVLLTLRANSITFSLW